MLTDNKEITTPEYWAKVYTGANDNAKQDASNNTRPKNTFDRFKWVADHAEGTRILGIGSGHAHVEKRIKSRNAGFILASDQCKEAMIAANYQPYQIINAYSIPYSDKYFDTVIATQCLEYMEDQDKALTEFKRVGKKFLCTIPLGSMEKWSQLFIYDQASFLVWIGKYGTVEVVEKHDDLLLVKIRFHED